MHVRVADEVWIATALLTRENPGRHAFRVGEIVHRAALEGFTDTLRPGVQMHASQHAVANKPPNPGTYRMLYATADKGRRLFRVGDDYHPAREGGKITPHRSQIPIEYHYLLDWYNAEFGGDAPSANASARSLQPTPLDRAGAGRSQSANEAIHVEITAAERELLSDRARRRGMQPEAFAADVLREMLRCDLQDEDKDEVILPVVDENGVFHPDRLDTIHRYFAESSAGLTSLSDEQLTREALYEDHD